MKQRSEEEIKKMVSAYREKKLNYFDQTKEPITESNIKTYVNDFNYYQGGYCYRCGKKMLLKDGFLIRPYKHCSRFSKTTKDLKDVIRIVCPDCAFINSTYEMEKRFESRDYLLVRAYHEGFSIYDDNGKNRKEFIIERLFYLYFPLIKGYEESFNNKLAKAGLYSSVDFFTEFKKTYLIRAIEKVDWKGERMENFSPKTFTLYNYVDFNLRTCKRDLERHELKKIRIKKTTKIKGKEQTSQRFKFLSTTNNDNSEKDFSSSYSGYRTPEEEFIQNEENRLLSSPDFIGDFRRNVKSRLSKNYVPVYEYILTHTFRKQRDIVRNGGFDKSTVSRAFKQIKEAENYYRNKML